MQATKAAPTHCRNNLQQELDWLSQNQTAALQSCFTYSCGHTSLNSHRSSDSREADCQPNELPNTSDFERAEPDYTSEILLDLTDEVTKEKKYVQQEFDPDGGGTQFVQFSLLINRQLVTNGTIDLTNEMMESEGMEDLASLDFAAVDDMVGQRSSITTTNPRSLSKVARYQKQPEKQPENDFRQVSPL